jgi:hypothetical protein
MTDAELEILARWQETPPAKVFDHIRTLEKTLRDLRELLTYREGAIEMRSHIKALIEAREELNALIYAARPVFQEAAE